MQQIEVRRERASDAARRVGAPEATVVLTEDDATVGSAHIATGNESVTLDVDVVDDSDTRQRAERTIALVRAALDAVAEDGGGDVHWWVPAATAADEETANDFGMVRGRALLQLRRPLPTGLPVDVVTRPFRPGVDEAAWVSVNNRAFAGHPEQGGWSIDTLLAREAEPWFDPAGFRLHERDGRLAAFCWTKLHEPGTEDTDGVGEIYVIGVDPDFQGLGLGRQLTLAGLDSIASRGVGIAMLYVDAANAAAVGMYERLGFTLQRTDRAFTVRVPAAPPS